MLRDIVFVILVAGLIGIFNWWQYHWLINMIAAVVTAASLLGILRILAYIIGP